MKRVVWLTDLHLNFLPHDEAARFLDLVAAERPDAVLLGGDIAEAHDVDRYLQRIDERLGVPVYFVLGNHDFYHGSIRRVRQRVAELCAGRPNLVYLSTSPPVQLAPGVALVGHDGWADGRLGSYETSMVMMNDYRLIEELAGMNKLDRWPLLHRLADEAAEHVRRTLPEALASYPRAFVLTHVPPFREACWHEGQISSAEWLPHFTSRAVGDALLDVADRFPQRQITVLCGHTHGRGQARLRDNLVVFTGGATYGEPEVQRVFELPEAPAAPPASGPA
jgi:predicted MPP superfamily phosphohydrolase